MNVLATYGTGRITTISSDGDTVSGVYTSEVGKNQFERLIKRSSRSIPKDSVNRAKSQSYNEKQTRSKKTENTLAKPRSKPRKV